LPEQVRMNRRTLIPLLFASALLAACAGTTPISKLALPPVTTIEGTVTKLDPKGFTLKASPSKTHPAPSWSAQNPPPARSSTSPRATS